MSGGQQRSAPSIRHVGASRALPGSSTSRIPSRVIPYRLYLVADGFGVHVKLPVASVEADPDTGRLTARFEGLPQFPFNDFRVHLFGSERGLLATPDHCGTYAVDSTFTPWDSFLPEQTSAQFFELNEGPEGAPCPGQTRGFDPTFQRELPIAERAIHSPFTFEPHGRMETRIRSGIEVDTPPGFTASLKGVPYCPEARSLNFRLRHIRAVLSWRLRLSQASQVGQSTPGPVPVPTRSMSRARFPGRAIQGGSPEHPHRGSGGLRSL